MKLVTASFVLVASLCAPAVADSPPAVPPPVVHAAAPLKIRFSLRDLTTTNLDVIIGSPDPCAMASEKHADRELHLRACVTPTGQLQIDWSTRSDWGEYHSTSSVPTGRGSTTELGSLKGPRLTVAIQ